MWQSLKEYIAFLGKAGWVVLVDIIGSSIGGYLDVSGNANIPTWLWLGFLLLGLLIAPFIAFHKLRVQRDNIQSELKNHEWEYRRKRLIELREPYLKELPLILRDMTKQVQKVTDKMLKNLPILTKEF